MASNDIPRRKPRPRTAEGGRRLHSAGSAIVVVLNKWDGLDTEGRAAAKASVGDRLAFLLRGAS